MSRSEDTQLEINGKRTYRRLFMQGVTSVTSVLLGNLGELSRLRTTSESEEHYVRPEKRFTSPEYAPEMKTTNLRERYLRPVPYCNCRAPEVVALAHKLGAYQKSDLEFARAAFQFAKEMTTLEIRPIQEVEETLRLGTGTCFELIGVFIALCRAAGIPARYKIFSTNMIQSWRESTIDADPLLQKWYDSLDNFLFEGEGEAFINGQWMVAHVGPTAERQAAGGIPVTEFGEDSLGVWFTAKPGTIMHLEALPWGITFGSRLLHRISPGSMERVNISVLKQIEAGKHILAEAGGIEAYNTAARAKAPATS